MIIIPAIDIKDGKCVRLSQGDFDRVTVYADNPVETAQKWEQKGAQLIHVVDLDGSVAGTPKNAQTILRLARAINVPIQVGGGIRDMETISFYLQNSVSAVILGTAALQNKEIIHKAVASYPAKIILGIDALDGKVSIQGWTQKTKENAVDLARRFENSALKAIVYTDIKRDGMGTGVNTDATRVLAEATDIPVIASGGVASIKDIQKLREIESCGIHGVIIGRALYTGAVRLEEAISEAAKPLK